MGGDGGSIPGRRDLVKEVSRLKTIEEITYGESNDWKWTHCSISDNKLELPLVVCDFIGNLFNKESILTQWYHKTLPIEFRHIEKFKYDIIPLNKNTIKWNVLEHTLECPITNTLANHKNHRFYIIRKCGCVMSQKALLMCCNDNIITTNTNTNTNTTTNSNSNINIMDEKEKEEKNNSNNNNNNNNTTTTTTTTTAPTTAPTTTFMNSLKNCIVCGTEIENKEKNPLWIIPLNPNKNEQFQLLELWNQHKDTIRQIIKQEKQQKHQKNSSSSSSSSSKLDNNNNNKSKAKLRQQLKEELFKQKLENNQAVLGKLKRKFPEEIDRSIENKKKKSRVYASLFTDDKTNQGTHYHFSAGGTGGL